MDLALSRLYVQAGRAGCPPSEAGVCPDQDSFERLLSEFATAMAPPINTPARSVGPRALWLSLGTTITSIEAQQFYWARGTEGSRSGQAYNASPKSALIWNRIEARKGLPFGLELGAQLGQGAATSLLSFGLGVKWALFEGFRSGLGRLPDVAIQGSVDQSVGSSQARVRSYALDLTLSKPFVIEHTWTVSPLGGVQMLFSHMESGVIDLTPAGPGTTPDPQQDATRVSGADVSNDVVFKPVSQTRARMFLGAEARYLLLTASLSLLFDLVAPSVQAPVSPGRSSSVARQVALSLAIGAVL